MTTRDPGPPSLEFGGNFEAGHARHFNVCDENVGRVFFDGLKSLDAIAGASHHRDIALDIKQRGQSTEHHALILGDYDADGLAAFLGRMQAGYSLTFDTGRWMAMRVPFSVSRSTVPPRDSIRSRMPRSPLPST